MDTIRIGLTSQRTTRLGFGCSGILGGLERSHSLALLESAFDAGIRHFDVAPMYGFGTAEDVLGKFLRRHPGAVTVTTKFGLLPDRRTVLARMASTLARPARHLIRSQRLITSGVNPRSAKPLNKLPFTAQQAARSLERSLQRLNLERVDLFLLHEAAASDLYDHTLLDFLQQQVNQGRIGVFGIGSAPELLPDVLNQRPEYCSVIQSNWAAGDAPLLGSDRFHVTHRAFQGNWQSVHTDLLHSKTKIDAWSEWVGVDLGDRTVWPALMLHAALTINTRTIVLFSSTSRSRIAQNVAAAQNTRLTLPATRLHQLLHATNKHSAEKEWSTVYRCR